MDRREFVGAGLASLGQNPPAKKWVRITVLKKTVEPEFQKYRGGAQIVACDRVKEGQEFRATSPWSKPEGLCDWAWADIRNYIHMVFSGGTKQTVACCTDGYRPVFFLIEPGT